MNDYIKRKDVLDMRFSVWLQDGSTQYVSYKEVKDNIKHIPTADVARVRHGHWINDIGYAGWTCSECGNHEGNKTDKYCHNCGAKMDGEEQEHE